MKTTDGPWLSAEEAMARLEITRATLYAYVSRGRIRSEPVPGKTRRRRYSQDDVERLLARNRERRNPARAAEQALHWGLPILESSITLIADGHVYYRGEDAVDLALDASLADVASLIWTGSTGHRIDAGQLQLPLAGIDPNLPFAARAQMMLAQAAADDALAFDLRPATIVRIGWRIVHLLASAAMPRNDADGGTIDERLAAAWNVPDATGLIRAALILSADHELNVSSFTARCVASAGASPYGVVIAGLAALEGFRHGGTTARIEAWWDSLVGAVDPRQALVERLRRGERTEGFGHPLYPGGDPRATVLLEMLPDSAAAAQAKRFLACATETIGELPQIDFALVAVARVLGLPPGTPLALFAIGRSIGWIGQALEQYADGSMIRPRARYVGKVPEANLEAADRPRSERGPWVRGDR